MIRSQHKVVRLTILFFVFIFTNVHAITVLLTGGAGFIGSHVVQMLLQRGDSVVVVDNFNDAYDVRLKEQNITRVVKRDTANRLHMHVVDIRDQASMDALFEQYQPDVICHLAGRAGVRGSLEMPAEYLSSNIMGTLTIFQLAKKYGVKQVVYASSSSVYGNCTYGPFKEDFDVSKPISPYAMTKCANELLAYAYHHLHKMSFTGLRFFTVYGPRGRMDMAPFLFLDAIYNGKTLHLYGDGSAIRDFTYVDDIVDGVIRAIDTPLDFEILNLGRGEPIVLMDFIKIIENIIGKKALISYEAELPADVALTHADISKTNQLLGYQPQVSVREGMQKMYEWYLLEYLPLMRGGTCEDTLHE